MGLGDWFGRPRRPTTSPAPVSAVREAWQQEDMAAALRIPEHVLLDTADVSAGSRGYSLHALERAGLMRIERVARDSPTAPGGWRFTLTARGLRHAARAAEGAAPVSAHGAAVEKAPAQADPERQDDD